jgi:transcriptional regulator with XRE-family HTH domain
MRLVTITPDRSGFLVRAYDSKKSSAVTAPPVASFIRATRGQDGRTIPRRTLLMVVRSAFASSPTASSLRPRSAIQRSSFMGAKVHQGHCACQAPSASHGVDTVPWCAHNARMTYFREWREFRGLTQEKAAGKVGRERSFISKLESGEAGYSRETLAALATAYDCEPGDLLSIDPRSDIRSIVEGLRKLARAAPAPAAEPKPKPKPRQKRSRANT